MPYSLLIFLADKAFWPANPNVVTVEEVPMDYKPASANNSLAVVPWVPSQASSAAVSESRIMQVEELMEVHLWKLRKIDSMLAMVVREKVCISGHNIV